MRHPVPHLLTYEIVSILRHNPIYCTVSHFRSCLTPYFQSPDRLTAQPHLMFCLALCQLGFSGGACINWCQQNFAAAAGGVASSGHTERQQLEALPFSQPSTALPWTRVAPFPSTALPWIPITHCSQAGSRVEAPRATFTFAL